MIAEALESARCVVVVWSRDSVTSSWVREEADEGQKRGVLIPVLIDEVRPPLGFGRIQAARMIEWDGTPESEAFQKLVADITAVIDAPSAARDPASETAAPKASEPEHVAGAQAVITTPDVSAGPRAVVHGRTPRLLLAGAVMVALLAFAIYQMVPGWRDLSVPPTTGEPAETTGLRLTAVLADGGKALSGVAYEVYAAARDAEGKRKHVTGSNLPNEAARFALPAGRYFVTAAYGSASANVEVEVRAARTTQQILNLRAGIVQLTAALADGGTAVSGVAYEVYGAAQDAEGKRKYVTGSNLPNEAARFVLPAGRYFVTAAYGSASANVEVEVTPAGVSQQILNLRAGILRLTAVLADGGTAVSGVAYEVYAAARNAEGKRKYVTGSNLPNEAARFVLPAGRYFVTAAYGSASANVEVEITPAGVSQQILDLRAGILRLTAVLADDGKALSGVAYEVYAAAQDAEGKRKYVTGSNLPNEAARFVLPAGRYFVSATYGRASANVEVEVTLAGVSQRILNLRAGILRLTAVLADGGKALSGVAYEVYAAAQDAEGKRKYVTGSNLPNEAARFALPAGRYFVTAAHSGANASAETVITAGGTKDVQLRIVPVTKR